jgi:hypothetical protein
VRDCLPRQGASQLDPLGGLLHQVEGGISVDDCDAIAATRGRLYELAAFSAPGDYAELARQKPCF